MAGFLLHRDNLICVGVEWKRWLVPDSIKEPPPAAEADRSPKVISQTAPKYSARLRKRGVSGKVILSATIKANGTIGKVNVKESSGHKALDKAALEAFAKWKFNLLAAMETL